MVGLVAVVRSRSCGLHGMALLDLIHYQESMPNLKLALFASYSPSSTWIRAWLGLHITQDQTSQQHYLRADQCETAVGTIDGQPFALLLPNAHVQDNRNSGRASKAQVKLLNT